MTRPDALAEYVTSRWREWGFSAWERDDADQEGDDCYWTAAATHMDGTTGFLSAPSWWWEGAELHPIERIK